MKRGDFERFIENAMRESGSLVVDSYTSAEADAHGLSLHRMRVSKTYDQTGAVILGWESHDGHDLAAYHTLIPWMPAEIVDSLFPRRVAMAVESVMHGTQTTMAIDDYHDDEAIPWYRPMLFPLEPRRGRPFASRIITKRLKLTPEEDADLQRRVDESGDTWSQYVRRRLFEEQ